MLCRPVAAPMTTARNPLLDPSARLVVGHRGAAALAPENTLESFARALRDGADALELDVHRTADGHVVVLHDPRLDRTTTGAGPVAAATLASLRGLPVRGDASARVPTLDALLETCAGVPMLIDAKSADVGAPLRRVLERHGAEHLAVVGSFHARHLDAFAGSRIATLATREEGVRLLLLGRVRSPRYAALAVPQRLGRVPLPMRRLAAAARRAGRALHVWTVDDPADAAALWAAGVCGVVTNDPGRLVPARDAAVARRAT